MTHFTQRFYMVGLIGLLSGSGLIVALPAHAWWWHETPQTFEAYLAQEYVTAAGFETNDGTDMPDATAMRERAVAVQQGNRVLPLMPEEVRSVRLSQEDLATGRMRLMRVLDNPEKIQAYPEAVAQAQVAYDCWALHQQAEPNASHNLHRCRDFAALINRLDMPAPAAAVAPDVAPDKVLYDVVTVDSVMFEWDSAKLTPAARAKLDTLHAALRNEMSPTKKLALQGFADRSGSEAYNRALSQRRVDAVVAYLDVDPADTVHIDLAAYGETNLPVPTADGVREPANRITKVAIVKEEAQD
jgi:OOP family OmpA-OmpF porin